VFEVLANKPVAVFGFVDGDVAPGPGLAVLVPAGLLVLLGAGVGEAGVDGVVTLSVSNMYLTITSGSDIPG
jgi:hypothetical protein